MVCIFAVLLFLFASVSLQEYCKDYNTDDPQCGATMVDGLDLQIYCVNSSSIHVKWVNKTEIQLVSLEFSCFNQSTGNFTTLKIKRDSAEPSGERVISSLDVGSVYDCVLFGCIYIDGKNCWQLNEGNASCESQTSSFGISSATSAASQTSNRLVTHMTSVADASTFLMTAVQSSSVSSHSINPSGTNPSDKRSNVYYAIMVVSIFLGMLLGTVMLVSLVFCFVGSKRNQKSATKRQECQYENEFSIDFKMSTSIYTLGTASMNESIVTNLSSLAHFKQETDPSEGKISDNQLLRQMACVQSQSHHTPPDNNRFAEETPQVTNNIKLCISASLSPTPSDSISSYCKMSEPSGESDTMSKTDTQDSTTSLNSKEPEKCNDCNNDMSHSFKTQDKKRDSCFVSAQDLFEVACNDNESNLKSKKNITIKLSGESEWPVASLEKNRSYNDNFEIDFCDIDVNSESKPV